MKSTIFPITIFRDGELVSADFTFHPGKSRGKLRLWNPTTDATLRVDDLNLVSAKQRIEAVATLPAECRDEATAHLLSMANEVADKAPTRPSITAVQAADIAPAAPRGDEQWWPEPVDGDGLYRSLVTVLREYLAFPSPAAPEAIALWVMFSHAHDAFEFSPMLVITSAVRSSGKSRVVDVLRYLCPKPLPAVNISDAALFRAINNRRPTFLLDEADNVDWRERRELVGLLNGGFSRGAAFIIRCVGEGAAMQEQSFSVWCPKAIALLKVDRTLPDTTISRSVVIRMRRRARTEAVTRFREREAAARLGPLHRQAARWARDHAAALEAAEPCGTDHLSDRAADAWSPLLAVADIIGVGERAREVALELSGGEVEVQDITEQLISDIRDVFARRDADRLASATLADELRGLEGSPWSEWGKQGKGLTPNQLARLLDPFSIGPRAVWIDNATHRGYLVRQFADVFSRYVPPECKGVSGDDTEALTSVSDCKAATSPLQSENGVSASAPMPLTPLHSGMPPVGHNEAVGAEGYDPW